WGWLLGVLPWPQGDDDARLEPQYWFIGTDGALYHTSRDEAESPEGTPAIAGTFDREERSFWCAARQQLYRLEGETDAEVEVSLARVIAAEMREAASERRESEGGTPTQ